MLPESAKLLLPLGRGFHQWVTFQILTNLSVSIRLINNCTDYQMKMTDPRLRIPKVFALILLISVLPLAIASQPAAGSSGFSFTTFDLGRFDVLGIRCPGSSTGSCWNVNGEPQIRADPAGNFYASSEYLPRVTPCRTDLDLVNPQCGGTGAWKSSDNGLHY